MAFQGRFTITSRPEGRNVVFLDAWFIYAAVADDAFDDNMVEMYKTKLQPQILHELELVPGLPWLSFTLIQIAADQYMLQISSDAPEDGKWQHLKCALQANVLGLPQLHSEVQIAEVSHAIEIARLVPSGQIQPFNEQSKNPFGVYSIGRSIGVGQVLGAGTLGGFITISHKGKPRTYGLTNNHVANSLLHRRGVWAAQPSKKAEELNKRQKERMSSRTLEKREKYREKGQLDEDSEGLGMSRVEIKMRRRIRGAKRLEEKFANQGKYYESKSYHFQAQQNQGRCSAGNHSQTLWNENIIYCPAYCDWMATRGAECSNEHQPHKLGKLREASGRTVAKHPGRNDYCVLDWALIDLNQKTLKRMRDMSGGHKLKPNFQLDLNLVQVSREYLY